MNLRNRGSFSFLFSLLLLLAPARRAGAQAVTATVSLLGHPTAVAVNPITKQIYVAYLINHQNCPPPGCSYIPTAAAIDESTNSVAALWSGNGADPGPAKQPGTVAVNPVTNHIYVLPLCCGITVIDGATNSATPIDTPSPYFASAVNLLTNKIYVANNASNNVTVIDGTTNSAATITDPQAGAPWAVDVNPITNKIYVANNGSSNVTVIDGATNTFVSIPVGNAPFAVSVNPITNKVYVANNASNGTVTVIDGTTNATTTVPAGGFPFALPINPVTNKIYVANDGTNNVTVIDGATNATTTLTDPTASHPRGVAVDALTNQIYVANDGSATVTVIDGATSALSTVTDPNAAGDSLALPLIPISPIVTDPLTNTVYMTHYTSTNVSVIVGVAGSQPPDFALATSVESLTLQAGAQATDTIVVGPPYGNSIELSCTVSGSAPLPGCELSSSMVIPGPTYGTATLTITAPTIAAMRVPSHHPRFGGVYATWLPMMFGIAVLGRLRKRHNYWLFGGLLLWFAIGLMACGANQKPPTNTQKSYTVTVAGASGTIQHTAQVEVTIE